MRTPLRSILAVALLLVAAHAAHAQTYPSRTITIVVPFPPGGAQDIAARLVAAKMAGELGQSVIVENRPGAAGTVGSASVARAAPDGYTLLIGSLGATVITPIAKKDVGYDPRTAFTAIAGMTSQPLILIVPESSPYRTLADLVAAGKQRTGKLNYATAGIGSVSNFASEQFNKTLGTDFVHVPYAGSAPALRALMSGEVAMYFAAASDAVARLKGGSVRGLLVTLPQRVPSAPDVPSLRRRRPEGSVRRHVVRPDGTGRTAKRDRREAERGGAGRAEGSGIAAGARRVGNHARNAGGVRRDAQGVPRKGGASGPGNGLQDRVNPGSAAMTVSGAGRELLTSLGYDTRDLTIGKVLARQVRRAGDKKFLTYLPDGRSFTFAEVDGISNRLANGFAALGLGRGAHVAIMMENRPEFILACWALGKLGAVAVPVNTASKGRLLHYYLDQSDSVALIVDGGLLDRLAELDPAALKIRTVIVVRENDAPLPRIAFGARRSPTTIATSKRPRTIRRTSTSTAPSSRSSPTRRGRRDRRRATCSPMPRRSGSA